jgi:hypothetical protein
MLFEKQQMIWVFPRIASMMKASPSHETRSLNRRRHCGWPWGCACYYPAATYFYTEYSNLEWPFTCCNTGAKYCDKYCANTKGNFIIGYAGEDERASTNCCSKYSASTWRFFRNGNRGIL